MDSVKQQVNPRFIGIVSAGLSAASMVTGMIKNKKAGDAADAQAAANTRALTTKNLGEQVSSGGEITQNGGVVNPFAKQLQLGGTAPTSTQSDLQTFDAGGVHEDHPGGGLRVGTDESGTPVTVEEGETAAIVSPEGVSEKFVYSNRVPYVPFEGLPKFVKGDTFADASKTIMKAFKDRKDKYSMDTQNELLNRLAIGQKAVVERSNPKQLENNVVQAAYGLPDNTFGNNLYTKNYGIVNPELTAGGLNLEMPNTTMNDTYEFGNGPGIMGNASLGVDMDVAPSAQEISTAEAGDGMGMGDAAALIGMGTQTAGIISNIIGMRNINQEKPVQPHLVSKLDVNANLINRGAIEKGIEQSQATSQRALLGRSGGNFSQYMSGVTGLSSGATKALSDAMLSADIADSAELARVQSINLGIDDRNSERRTRADEATAQNNAAYTDAKTAYSQGIAANLGNMGTTAMNYGIAQEEAKYLGQEAILRALELKNT